MIKLRLLIILLLLYSCNNTDRRRIEIDAQPESLVGTWLLKSHKHNNKDTSQWQHYGEEYLFEKYITDTHFIWMKYNLKTDHMEKMGGGTYSFDGKTYIENIDFYLPPGSKEHGQSISFRFEIKNNMWYHTGYFKGKSFDPVTNRQVDADSSRIAEIWVKSTEPAVDNATHIHGTWHLTSYKTDPLEPNRLEYPDFIGYLKLITPTHFAWVQYNKEGDEILGAGSGTYYFQQGKYVEVVNTLFPIGTDQMGTVIPFDLKMTEGIWHHSGYIILKTKTKNGEIYTRPHYIDEHWENIISEKFGESL